MALRAVGDGRVAGGHGLPAKEIYALGDRFEVGRVHAMADSAEMVKLVALRDRPDNLLVGCPVSENYGSVPANLAISALGERSKPQPTGVSLSNLAPKGFAPCRPLWLQGPRRALPGLQFAMALTLVRYDRSQSWR